MNYQVHFIVEADTWHLLVDISISQCYKSADVAAALPEGRHYANMLCDDADEWGKKGRHYKEDISNRSGAVFSD